jgi:hypothetical protein
MIRIVTRRVLVVLAISAGAIAPALGLAGCFVGGTSDDTRPACAAIPVHPPEYHPVPDVHVEIPPC